MLFGYSLSFVEYQRKQNSSWKRIAMYYGMSVECSVKILCYVRLVVVRTS